MSSARGRRTRHVVVYLSDAEAQAWDTLRGLQRGAGWAGTYPPSRAAWVMARVWAELERVGHSPAQDQAQAANAALDALSLDLDRYGGTFDDAAPGRIQSPKPTGRP